MTVISLKGVLAARVAAEKEQENPTAGGFSPYEVGSLIRAHSQCIRHSISYDYCLDVSDERSLFTMYGPQKNVFAYVGKKREGGESVYEYTRGGRQIVQTSNFQTLIHSVSRDLNEISGQNIFPNLGRYQ